MSATPRRALVPLRPAVPRTSPPPRVTFFDLPAELRIEIYKLALQGVVVHILPPDTFDNRSPHALTRTSRQVRNEVLPMMHSICPIRCAITDFNFAGLLLWISRIPPDQEAKLLKNERLEINLATTPSYISRSLSTLRKWLHLRADDCRPQPKWRYKGPRPHAKICADLRRKAKRMTEVKKQHEMMVMLRAVGIECEPDRGAGGGRRQGS